MKKPFITILMIVAGLILIILGIGFPIYKNVQAQAQNNSLDATVQALDQNSGFIPLLQPITTSTSTPSPTAEPGIVYPTVTPTPEITPTPTTTEKYIPDRIVISAIGLDAPVIPVSYTTVHLAGQTYEQWLVPDKFAAGWQDTTALLGVPGNTVLNGHHNVFGEVFKGLIDLNLGDKIEVYSGTKVFTYIVVQKLLLKERWQTLEKRAENAQWIMPTADERLTLVTCWPPSSNTHRLIIVAYPEK